MAVSSILILQKVNSLFDDYVFEESCVLRFYLAQRFWHHSIAVPLPFHYPLVSKTVTFPRSPFPLRYHFYWDRFWIEDTWKCSKFHITKRYLPFFLNHFQPLTGINLKKPFFTVSGRFYLETVPIEMVT